MTRSVLAREVTAIHPGMIGRPIAGPGRRVSALLCDVLVLLLPTLIAAAAASLTALYLSDRPAFDALRTVIDGSTKAEDRQRALGDLIPLLCRLDDTSVPATACAAEEEGDRERARAILSDYKLVVSFSTQHAKQIVPEGHVFVQAVDFIPSTIRTVAVLLVPALYFTFLTAGRRGATLGKRLFRIEVVKLDGRRLTLLESLERFGAYFAVLGTVGIGAFDLWRDPNRQLAHDRVARTVVLQRQQK